MSLSDYRKTVEVRWADLDPNRHVRSTVYADYAAHARVAWMSDHGFPLARLEELGIGPVLMREDSRFFREVTLGEQLTIILHLNGYSADGSHWRFRQALLKASGQVAATVEVEGGWLDLRARRFIAPPAELLALVDSLRQPEDLEELPSLLKPRT